MFLLPFKIICIVLKHQKEVKKYKQNIKKSFLNKRLPLEFYKDYQEALDLKNQKLIRLLHNIGFKIMSFKG